MHAELNNAIALIHALKENFTFNSVNIDNKLEDIALSISTTERTDHPDSIRRAADMFVNSDSARNAKKLKQEIFAVFYKVGLIHIKTSKGASYKACYNSSASIDPNSIDEEAKFKIDPTFWRSFSITPNI